MTLHQFFEALWVALVAFYLWPVALASVLVLRQVVSGTLVRSQRPWLKTSLAFNNIAGVVAVSLTFAILAELPLGNGVRFLLVPILATVLPYALSFFRASGVGLNAGTIGVVAGLLWFGGQVPEFAVSSQAPYLVVVSSAAFASGWLGGFVGKAAIREAMCAISFDIELRNGGSLVVLIGSMKRAISRVYTAYAAGAQRGSLKRKRRRPDVLLVAQRDSQDERISLQSLNYEMAWRHRVRPRFYTHGWLVERPVVPRSLDEILDSVLNFFRNTVTTLKVSHVPDCANQVRVTLVTRLETPSIEWLDEPTIKLATEVEKAARQSVESSARDRWVVASARSLTVRHWRQHPALEQHAKRTLGSASAGAFLRRRPLTPGPAIAPALMAEFSSAPRLFQSWRGKVSTFVGFLALQVLLGLILDWFSNQVLSAL